MDHMPTVGVEGGSVPSSEALECSGRKWTLTDNGGSRACVLTQPHRAVQPHTEDFPSLCWASLLCLAGEAECVTLMPGNKLASI